MTMSPNKKSLFVTGGSGFLGRRFLELMDRSVFEKVVCLRHSTPVADLPGITFVEGDLEDSESYRAHIEEGMTIVHLAGLTGKGSKADHFKFNFEATQALLRAAADQAACEFLFVSSVAVAFEDRSGYHYAEAKEVAEQAVLTSSIPSLIVRPTMIFGPDAPVLQGLAKLASAPIVPVFGGGENQCQPVFVDDLAKWLEFAIHGMVFDDSTHTIGGSTKLTMKELLVELRQRSNKGTGGLVRFPLRSTRFMLRVAEPLLLSLLPLTAGQLASFANDSISSPLPESFGGNLLTTPLSEMF
ncbi:MAG: nucleoside-diphosphate-sugar epimerase [Planctomycetota bacterium]|jgi:nucleoside-diphosphate-sugar epimerase